MSVLKRLLGLVALLACLLAAPATAQTVQYNPPITRGHLPYWVTSGVLADGGSAADSPVTSIGATGQICSNSARQSSGAWNQLCLQANTNAPATISLQNFGTAAPQGLNFDINGTVVAVPTGGGSFIFGNGPFTPGDVPCFFSAAGVVQDCGLAINNGIVTSGTWHGSPIGVGFGGTGATSAAGAQANLGLGTMAVQNSNNVSITGGAITGMPTPVNPTDVAIKSYVDAIATGLIILPQSALATAAVLPNTPTYNNGTAGVGATLTAGSNSTLTVDGTVAALNTVVLVKNQASAFQNGIYTVTTAGSGAAAWVLTRATYFDQGTTEMKAGSYTFITGGATNANSSWTLAATVVTVGTDPANFNQFSSTTGAVSSINGLTGALTLGTLTATATGASTARSVNNLFGDFLTVKDFGAVGNGVTNDQTAFQAMIDASCPGHLSVVPPAAAVNQIFPIILPASANPYLVTQLNATNCAGFSMTGLSAGGSPAISGVQPIIKYTTNSNTILDMTGSGAGCSLKGFGILGATADASIATYPIVGLLIAPTSAGGANYCELDNVNVSGRFQAAGTYIYGVCCSLATMANFDNFNQGNPNTFGLVLTSSNTYSFGVGTITSIFTTIGSGAFSASDWTFNRSEAHAFTSGATTSPQAIFWDGVSNINWVGGQIAAAANTLGIMKTNAADSLMNFRGTTFYTDQGPAAPVLFNSVSGGTLKHLVMEDVYIQLAAGGTLFNGQSSVSGSMIESTYQLGATVTQVHFAGLGTSPAASSCGTPTVTGTDQDGTVTAGGTTTGCTITFATPFNSVVPACIVSSHAGNAGLQYAVDAMHLGLAWTSASGVVVDWHCWDKIN